MTPAVRVIRFARVDAAPPPSDGGSVVARVLLNEHPDAAGHIVRRERMWDYVLADGTASGLSSAESRQDLERQIVLYHLGTVASDEPAIPPVPLKIAM
jgi:hypothetical protein